MRRARRRELAQRRSWCQRTAGAGGIATTVYGTRSSPSAKTKGRAWCEARGECELWAQAVAVASLEKFRVGPVVLRRAKASAPSVLIAITADFRFASAPSPPPVLACLTLACLPTLRCISQRAVPHLNLIGLLTPPALRHGPGTNPWAEWKSVLDLSVLTRRQNNIEAAQIHHHLQSHRILPPCLCKTLNALHSSMSPQTEWAASAGSRIP